MKNLIYAFVICILAASCEKYDSGPANQSKVNKKVLTESETILKENLNQAAQILANVIQDEAVMNELTLISDENRTFYNLTFKDLLAETKGINESFRTLREKFMSECSSVESKGGSEDLRQFLIENNSYIYCPYPSSFYPKGKGTFTVASHPIDNEEEGVGYRYDGKNIVEVMVNEEYTDKNQVLLIMPKDEDAEDLAGLVDKGIPDSKATVYEVKVGKVWCANYCGGLFEGELELRISRGYPQLNLTTGALEGKFSTVIPIGYPRSYAKAAIRDYTIHSNGGWYTVSLPWDTNWRTEKAQQCILVYEYDKVSERTVSANLGYKPDNSSGTITITAKTTYSGDFLGINEWDRDWFYATNSTPRYGDEVKDGLVIRKTCDAFKLTTPSRIIN